MEPRIYRKNTLGASPVLADYLLPKNSDGIPTFNVGMTIDKRSMIMLLGGGLTLIILSALINKKSKTTNK